MLSTVAIFVICANKNYDKSTSRLILNLALKQLHCFKSEAFCVLHKLHFNFSNLLRLSVEQCFENQIVIIIYVFDHSQ